MRRALIVLAGLAVSGAGLLLLLGVFSDPEKATTDVGVPPGVAVPAQAGALGALLRPGNLVLAYRDPPDAAAARRAAAALAGAPTPALVAAGQAIVVRRRAQGARFTALAWKRAVGVASLRDPRLAAFVDRWLGEPARG